MITDTKPFALCYSTTSKALIACFALVSSFWVHAAEVRQLEVSRDGQMYRLYSEMFVNAPHSDVRSLLARYDAVAKLDPDITKVEMLGANPDGTLRMRLASKQCVLVFCFSYRWTQDVLSTANGNILAKILPGGGDLTSGWVLYRTAQSGTGTRLIVDAHIAAPALKLPRAVVRHFMRRKLKNKAYETASLVERAAINTGVN